MAEIVNLKSATDYLIGDTSPAMSTSLVTKMSSHYFEQLADHE